MKDGKIGYGVLGLGIGKAHAAAVNASDNACLTSLCDINTEKLSQAGELYPNANLYDSFERMLDDGETDIISICLPSGLHAEYAIEAMRRGKHVLIEKPVDILTKRADDIIHVSRETGMTAGVVFQNRGNLIMYPLKKALSEGRFGKIALGTFSVRWYREQQYYDDGGWHGTWNMDGGGSLINQSIHTLDLMRQLMGDVESVMSADGIYGHSIETEDSTASVIKLKSGAIATFSTTTCAYPGICTEISLSGMNGSVVIDSDSLKLWKFKDASSDEEKNMLAKFSHGNRGAAKYYPDKFYGHKYSVEDIIHAVTANIAPCVTVEDAKLTLATVNAVYESARTARAVRPDDML